MKNLFDAYVNTVIMQLNEQEAAAPNLNPNVVSSFKDVLKPLANNQTVDAKNNPSVDKNRLAAAIQAGIIEQRPDGTHAVTNAAITHISPDDPDIGGKFVPAETAAAGTATPNTSQKQATQPSQSPAPQAPQTSSTNNAGVVSSVYSPNKR